ncbi:MAG: hypothetical protein Q8L00_01960, partial [Deltaproteobacteria bacterium]|nr:hypothetical protein [Deltaproteobacteria bacterium]
GQPFNRHPAGHDQGLSLGPALGQAPSHQELVEPGLHIGMVMKSSRFKVQSSRFKVAAAVGNVGCVLRTMTYETVAGEDARPS